MEVLQIYSQSHQISPRDTSELLQTSQENIKQLLELPPIPAGIRHSVDTASVRNPQPAVVDVSPSPSTSTRNTTFRSNSLATTSNTSVLLKPSRFTIKKIYVNLQKDMDENVKSTWIHSIREPLRVVLGREVSNGSCVQEFMMAGKSQTKLSPTVVVSCGNAKVMRQVEKAFSRLDWLQAILKENRIAFVAVVQEIRLSSKVMDQSGVESLDTTQLWLEDCDDEKSFCGRRAKCGTIGQVQCVLGGIIMLDGEPYALTAAHPFRHLRESQLASMQNSKHDEADSSDTASRSDSEEPFWFDPNDDVDSPSSTVFGEGEDASSAIQHSQPSKSLDAEPEFQSQSEMFQRVEIPVSWGTQSIDARITTMRNLENDWAVVALDSLPSTMPNIIPHAHRLGFHQLRGFAASGSDSDVQVIYANQSFCGLLQPLPCTLQVDTHVFTVQMISMDEGLPLGCSGSWVVADDNLVGLVIAVREDMPWLYMIPIQQILYDIRSALGVRHIELPKQLSAEKENLPERYVMGPSSSTPRDRQTSSPRTSVSALPMRLPEGAFSDQSTLPLSDQSLFESQQPRDTANQKPSYEEVPIEAQGAVHLDPAIPSVAVTGTRGGAARLPAGERLCRVEPISMRRQSLGTGDLENAEERMRHKESRFTSMRQSFFSYDWRIWHRYERALLVTEYRRRWDKKQVWTWSNRPRTPRGLSNLGWIPTLIRQHPRMLFLLLGRLIIFPFLMIAFVLSLCLWNVVYYLSWPLHGPCRLWVVQRHREVLLDLKTLERDREESYEMLDVSPREPYPGTRYVHRQRHLSVEDDDIDMIQALPVYSR